MLISNFTIIQDDDDDDDVPRRKTTRKNRSTNRSYPKRGAAKFNSSTTGNTNIGTINLSPYTPPSNGQNSFGLLYCARRYQEHAFLLFTFELFEACSLFAMYA